MPCANEVRPAVNAVRHNMQIASVSQAENVCGILLIPDKAEERRRLQGGFGAAWRISAGISAGLRRHFPGKKFSYGQNERWGVLG